MALFRTGGPRGLLNKGDYCHFVYSTGIPSISHGNTVTTSPQDHLLWNIDGYSSITANEAAGIFLSSDGETFSSVNLVANTPYDVTNYKAVMYAGPGVTLTIA